MITKHIVWTVITEITHFCSGHYSLTHAFSMDIGQYVKPGFLDHTACPSRGCSAASFWQILLLLLMFKLCMYKKYCHELYKARPLPRLWSCSQRLKSVAENWPNTTSCPAYLEESMGWQVWFVLWWTFCSARPDGPYCLSWQGLLSCKLLAISAYTAADILIDINSTVIIKITNFLPCQYSSRPPVFSLVLFTVPTSFIFISKEQLALIFFMKQ